MGATIIGASLLIGVAVWLAWPVVSNMMSGAEEEWVMPSIAPSSMDYSAFSQPAVIEALHDGDSNLAKVIVKIPPSAPSFLQSNSVQSQGQRTIKKAYLYSLALALNDFAKEERIEYLPEGTPLLGDLVKANVAYAAKVSLESDDETVIPSLAPGPLEDNKIFTAIVSIFAGEELRKEANSLAGLLEAIKNQGIFDAKKLKELYYFYDAADVEAVYASLSTYILGGQVAGSP
ncbi:MAG TPA: hypothetical protein DDY14_07265 [Chromatiaceae bacterium]|jgi:hypothetical protein|nr:MAG: hypothetical protein N838_25145 [Thiohalocapsa sp. PB-PSB1]HBG95113.1 hypothetical protein [Chromatiaceae bacterium]HCS89462.1 hypothetical protein [Chromatiaceae bacterium]